MTNPSLRQKVAKHLERLSIPLTTGMRIEIKCKDCDFAIVATTEKELARGIEYMRQHKGPSISNNGMFL